MRGALVKEEGSACHDFLGGGGGAGVGGGPTWKLVHDTGDFRSFRGMFS